MRVTISHDRTSSQRGSTSTGRAVLDSQMGQLNGPAHPRAGRQTARRSALFRNPVRFSEVISRTSAEPEGRFRVADAPALTARKERGIGGTSARTSVATPRSRASCRCDNLAGKLLDISKAESQKQSRG